MATVHFHKFKWGPLAQGIYTAMLWLTVGLGWLYPNMLIYYIPLLIFLGLGLRPLIERTGLYEVFTFLLVKIENKKWDKITQQKRREVARSERDKKYRMRRTRDPKLPKNW